MTEKFSFIASGTVAEHTEGEIVINDISYLPVEILDIAAQWAGLARERDWPLLDPQGARIDFVWHMNQIAAKIAGTED